MEILIALLVLIAGKVADLIWSNKILLAILAVVVAFAGQVSSLFGWGWGKIFALVRDWMLHILDPAVVLTWAVSVIDGAFQIIAYFLPEQWTDSMAAMRVFLQGIPFQKILEVFVWVADPFIRKEVVLGCLRAVIGIWFLTSAIRLIIWAKMQMPGGGSA